MFRSLSAILAVATLVVSAWSHGGTYRGPGTTTGPGGPSGPSTPGGPGGGTPGPSTGGAADAGGDLAAWQQWWALNRDQYLQLKRALSEGDLVTGTDTFFLGPDGKVSASPGRPSADIIHSRIVPTLLGLLAADNGPDIASAGLLATAKIGSGDVALVVQALRERVASANQEISESAALALGVLADGSAAGTLVELLDDTSSGRKLCGREEVPTRTRAFAAYALGLIGHNSKNVDVRRFVVHHLVSAMAAQAQASSRDVSVACAIALGIVPIDPIEAQDEDAPASASRSGVVAGLMRLLDDPKVSEFVRAYAAVPIARLAQDEPALRASVVSTLVNELTARPEVGASMRQSAVTALGLIADADDEAIDVAARAALRSQIGAGDRLARRLSLIALARIAARRGEHDGDAKTLQETRAFLLAELARGSTPERPWVGLALGILEHDIVQRGDAASIEVRTALANALVLHPSPVEAGAYAIGLGLVGGEVSKPLLDLLDDTRDDQVRSYAAVALGMARVRAGVEPLRKLVRVARYRPGLLREVSIGLGLLGDKTVSLELIELLKEAQGMSAQGAIATALGWVGDSRAIEPLLAVALDTTRTNGSRAFSIVALGLIADARPLPWNVLFASDSNYWIPPSTLFDPIGNAGVLDIL